MNKTKIEWTDATWNPLRGCSRVSDGCRNCYAETVAHRFNGPGQPYEGLTVVGSDGPRWNGTIKLLEDKLQDPLRWKRPRMIFVNRMSDCFHENVPFEWLDKMFAVMALCPQHTFQILTKRPERMREYMNEVQQGRLGNINAAIRGILAVTIKDSRKRFEVLHDDSKFPWAPRILPNAWLGVSVEDQRTADKRIPILLDTPAAVRWISAEPLLGSVDLTTVVRYSYGTSCDSIDATRGTLTFERGDGMNIGHGTKLDWVVVGGESGPHARPMNPEWARSLRDQCAAAGVPFFFKQWGEWYPWNQDMRREPEERVIQYDGAAFYQDIHVFGPDTPTFDMNHIVAKVGKKKAGRMLDGRTWDEYPEVRS
jgi:protein gp37